MKNFKNYYPHLLAILGFVCVAVLYFYPVVQGKALYQSDIAQYTGMAKEQNDFRIHEKAEPFWTNSAFGGMPTYQLGAKYPHNYIKKLDETIRFLPRPADYLFLYFIGFYVLLLVLKIDPLKAFFGALAFGFSTYLIIILGVGHNAKAHAIGYMPMVLAGIILVFQKRFVIGGLLTMFAIALEINANHFQMTYYLLIPILTIAIFYSYNFVINKDFKKLITAICILATAAIIALGANATGLLATAEYAKSSIRNKSELTQNADGSKNTTKSAMEYDYITEYSYGIVESLNLFAPRLFGGSNNEKLDKSSNVYEFFASKGIPEDEAMQYSQNYGMTYWGDQPIVAAPAYIGVVVFFLAILGLFLPNSKIKYAFLTAGIFALLLSWGKNFSALTQVFIDYVPMYDKFRAVSSIQVVLELCMPVLAIFGFHNFFKLDKQQQINALWKSTATFLGIILLLYIFKNWFDFAAAIDPRLVAMFNEQSDDKSFGLDFVRALKADRESMYVSDLLRSAFFIITVAGLFWFFIKNKISQQFAVIAVGFIMIADLVLIDKKYLNAKECGGSASFLSKHEVNEPFVATATDLEIQRDSSIFRVYEMQARLQARTSYFHKSVGGYSAVRPQRMDQLFDYQIDKQLAGLQNKVDAATMQLSTSIPVLNALNIKYLIVATEKDDVAITNPFVYGNAWFVNQTKIVTNADEELKSMENSDLKNYIIINKNELSEKKLPRIILDSTASIVLKAHKPNYISYLSDNKNEGLAVFSEMYYPHGWKVLIDGKESSHFRADFVLRAMIIPAGKHKIEFKFDPQVVKTGSLIALISSILMLFLLIYGIIYIKNSKTEI